jgi:2-polyprenyl-3-methyl-5-hydroxy-6-metoxy-1,4-benzoquinol methylase
MNDYEVTGIDHVEDAISDARKKAIDRHVKVNFVTGNVL